MSACRNCSSLETRFAPAASAIRSHVLAPRDDFHAEGRTNPRNLPADIAKPHYSQNLAAKILAD
jgi:hypothetical protein